MASTELMVSIEFSLMMLIRKHYSMAGEITRYVESYHLIDSPQKLQKKTMFENHIIDLLN